MCIRDSKFIGKFDVPMPEPTPEELAAEEKRRQKRIRDHEKYLRQKERKKKIAEDVYKRQGFSLVVSTNCRR